MFYIYYLEILYKTDQFYKNFIKTCINNTSYKNYSKIKIKFIKI